MLDEIIKIDDVEAISGLTTELKALYLSKQFKMEHQAMIVVSSSLYEANKLYTAISNYTNDVLLFPMDDFLTSEAIASSPELKVTRLETLKALVTDDIKIVVTDLMGYLRFLPLKASFKEASLSLKVGSNYDFNDLVKHLYQIGYTKETVVTKTGEMAVRGFVLDLFPLSYSNPIRLEFWGDTIDSIREFNIDTQLTIKELDGFQIDPITEFITTKDVELSFQSEKYLPNYEKVTNIRDYVANPLVVYNDYNQIMAAYQLLNEEIQDYNQSINCQIKYMHTLESLRQTKELAFFSFDNQMAKHLRTAAFMSQDVEHFKGNIKDINQRLNHYLDDNMKVIICVSNQYQAYKIIDELQNKQLVLNDSDSFIEHKINIIIKHIQAGFIFNRYMVISEQEIFDKEANATKYKTNFKCGTKIRDISKLEPGDYVVHMAYGIGRYCGLKTLTKQGLTKDYLQIVYKDDDKLYIPVENINMISKYSASESGAPHLNKLGSTEWEKTKLRVRQKIQDIADDLLKLYAKREAEVGFAYEVDSKEQLDFEKEFPYAETIDQIKVVNEIKKDMESTHPMDRLLCGDVGFGKTEVAFRAIMKAILSGKQVAMLCPTTILSNQHYRNALERFKSFPVDIALLNRFTTNKEQKQILEKLKTGQIDFLIGTHRLLSKDVQFKNLGLLVVDEEQRFGVKQKEMIKQYKTNIDVLTLSATPIPRTLQMSLSGIRSLSLLATPPSNRYPVQTYVLAANDEVIKDAIYKELSRHGQIFILYNHIDNMPREQLKLHKLVPEARIASAHGRMNRDDIDDVMLKFINKEYDVMLCTTIIENGIDIPNANTLIIMDADRFGLAQLYQIRGRVGRSERIAYCYLMYDKTKILSEVATKRLKVIREFTELGSGFSIAVRDLAIRGAGDILGSEQAGFVDSVGIELYLKMLNEEIAVLKGEPVRDDDVVSPPLVEVNTAISSKYVKEEDLKIEIHKKINTIDSFNRLKEVKEEIEDRFGKISDEMEVYMYQEWFDKEARDLGINHINQTKNSIEIMLSKDSTKAYNMEHLFMDLSAISSNFRFRMQFNHLVIVLDIVGLDKHFIYYLLDLIKVLKSEKTH